MKPWIILDRDGVINHDSDEYVKSPEEWIPIDGSLEAIVVMNQKGFNIGVATNQSGVGRGLYTETILADMHEKMHHLLASLGGKITTVCYCPHLPNHGCVCRKPEPGMLEDIAAQNTFELSGVPFVGDSLRDLQAALRVGCQPVLVKTGYGEKTLRELDDTMNTVKIYDNLLAFAQDLPVLNDKS